MSNTIDILCVIDAATLAGKVASAALPKGSASNPTYLGAFAQSDPFIYMITKQSYVVNPAPDRGEGTSELQITCGVTDNLRWTITNPGAGAAYSCILYDFASGAIGTAISTPVCMPLQVHLYVNGNPPTTPTPINYTSTAWQTTALGPCTSVQYSWCFQLLDSGGNVLGYFKWDPFITITLS